MHRLATLDPFPPSSAPLRLAVPPYRPRRIRFERLATSVHGTLKLYTISADGTPVDPSVITAAVITATDYLSRPIPPLHAATIAWHELPAHGAGALIVHRALDTTFVLLDWWVGFNMLRHRVWVAPNAAPHALQSIDEAGIAMCVWELAVIQHERAAWLRHVLTPDAAGRLDAYFADTITADL
jgi:hypothetical protein